MFDTLSEKLTGIFNSLSSRGRVTEKDIDEALSQVRRSLLEADVNFRVARDFVVAIKEKALHSDVLTSLTPGQQVIKIVHEELTGILTSGDHNLTPSSQLPSVLMLVGLQGAGKTTTAAKLALHMRKQGHSCLLVAADLKRPAAIEQLHSLGRQLDVPVYSEDPTTSTPLKVALSGVKQAAQNGNTWVIVDTGGRIQIDDELMQELTDIREAINPHQTLFVLDAMTGQEAVNAAKEFHDRVQLSGLIMTKLDGDARGGAALSATQVTGVPIKFVGVSERPDGLEVFHPDRIASRILGMGDVLSLIEKAQQTVDEDEVKVMEKKLRQATFDLDDFLQQIQNVKKMGSLSQIMDMLPGMGQMGKQMPGNFDDSQMKKIEAIIQSMTSEERHHPELINGSRRRRIATGSGTTAQDINLLLNQFKQTQKIMRRFAKTKNPRALMNMFK